MTTKQTLNAWADELERVARLVRSGRVSVTAFAATHDVDCDDLALYVRLRGDGGRVACRHIVSVSGRCTRCGTPI